MNKKFWKIILQLAEWLIFAVLLGMLFIMLSPLLPTKNYIATYIVLTGSMEPNINPGSAAFIQPVIKTSLQKGDIIAFTAPTDSSETILHRIYAVDKDGENLNFITKGDNNNAPDAFKVTASLVKGRYLFNIPYIGHPTVFLKTKIGFALIVGLPALILAFLQLKKIYQGIKEVRKKDVDTLGLILLGFITTLSVTFIFVPTVKAVYSARATVSGITFSTLASFSGDEDNDDDSDHEDSDEHENEHEDTHTNHGDEDNKGPESEFKISDDRRSLSFRILHLKKYHRLSYQITYDTDSISDGVFGDIETKGDDIFNEDKIILGTCSSHGTCTYCKGVKNIRLEVNVEDELGRKIKLSNRLD